MNRQCNDIQATMVELAGDLSALDDRDRQHLEHCDACRGRTADEVGLAEIFATTMPPADPNLQETVVAALAAVTGRRRWLAGAPFAASLLVVLVGLRALEGVPGAGLASELASRSAGSWFVVVDSALASLAGLAAMARLVAELMPLSIGLAAATAGLLGWVAVNALTRRWRRIPAWFARS